MYWWIYIQKESGQSDVEVSSGDRDDEDNVVVEKKGVSITIALSMLDELIDLNDL